MRQTWPGLRDTQAAWGTRFLVSEESHDQLCVPQIHERVGSRRVRTQIHADTDMHEFTHTSVDTQTDTQTHMCGQTHSAMEISPLTLQIGKHTARFSQH